jgi:hypothetical protein
MHTPKYVRAKFASEYLWNHYGIRHSPAYLAKLRHVGGGPPFHKAGRDPLYTIAGLDSYAEGRISGPLNSMAELSAA